MYLSASELQTVRTNALGYCEQLNRSYLDYLESASQLKSDYFLRLLADAAEQLGNAEEISPQEMLERTQAFGRHVAQDALPAYVVATAHASAAHAGQLWETTARQFIVARELAQSYFHRSLQASPWEAFWLVHLGHKVADESLTAATHLASVAAQVAERTDQEVHHVFPAAATLAN